MVSPGGKRRGHLRHTVPGRTSAFRCRPSQRARRRSAASSVRSQRAGAATVHCHTRQAWAPLYYTVAHLAEGGWRTKENVVASHWVWTEVDFKDHADITPKEILRRIHASPRRPNLIVFSGHGYHVFWRLAEPVDARPGEAQQRLEEVLRLAGTYLGGDSSVA